jgi:beta-glucanase (GH16 family)
VAGATWQLLFQDEFEGDALDADKWVRCYWWSEWADDGGCTIVTNAELQWYQPENVLVEGGHLTLQARQQRIHASNGQAYDYTSGIVTTGRAAYDRTLPPKFAFQYGYAEIRAKVPAGQGLWSAFWLLPEVHRPTPEIDVLEVLGHDPTTLHMFLHHSDKNGEYLSSGETLVGTDLAAGWHTYGVLWTPHALVWYLDGAEARRVDDPALIPHTPMYLLLNLAVGGDWPGAPDASTPFPGNYEIDYVRVWGQQTTVDAPLVGSTYVDADAPDTMFGDAAHLPIHHTPSQTAYLTFDTTALADSDAPIDSATLRIWTSGDYGTSWRGTRRVYLVESVASNVKGDVKSERWAGQTPTYNSQPELGLVVGELATVESDEIYDIKLDASLLQAHMGEVLTLALVATEGDGLSIYGSGSEAHRPRLTLTHLAE